MARRTTGSTTRRRFGERAGEPFTFLFDQRPVEAWPGESVAAALLAADEVDLRTGEDGGARGVLCSIGVCWECRCVIDGRPNTRACMTEARPGMQVQRQQGLS
ncbi:MAG: (2Fe-2S)-binding protein [Acidiferrobacterales bacterium]